MAGLNVILLYACKLAFLASSTCVKTIEFAFKNEARKADLHVHKRIIIMPAIMKEVYITKDNNIKKKTSGPGCIQRVDNGACYPLDKSLSV